MRNDKPCHAFKRPQRHSLDARLPTPVHDCRNADPGGAAYFSC